MFVGRREIAPAWWGGVRVAAERRESRDACGDGVEDIWSWRDRRNAWREGRERDMVMMSQLVVCEMLQHEE